MSTRRLLFVHAVILFVLAGSTYDILTRQEHWPFSNYPMFSNVHRRPVLSWLRVFGVTSDDREIALLAYNDLWPLDQSRLPLGLRHIASQPEGAAKLQIALSDVLTRYNSRRAEGDIEGPELRAIRLYRLEWPLERFAANLENPRTRELLAEVPAASWTER